MSDKPSILFKGSKVQAFHFLVPISHLLFGMCEQTSIVRRDILRPRLTYVTAIRKAENDHTRSPTTSQGCGRSWTRSTEGTVSKFPSITITKIVNICTRTVFSIHNTAPVHPMSSCPLSFNNKRYHKYRRVELMTVVKAANEALIKNLTRENSMIATAWYDLSSRLQSNHLVLQRRQDMPKSWLSKQRLMVNATPRR